MQEPCPTPFSDQSARAQPTCDSSCCSGDAEEGGQWVPHQGYTGHKVFQPAECEYSQYTRKEILTYFQGAGVDIVVVGDSFIRQLFVRLVHLMRSQVKFCKVITMFAISWGFVRCDAHDVGGANTCLAW